MPYQVIIADGLSNVVLPDGLRYRGGEAVVLSDDEYGMLSAYALSTLLSSVTSLSGGLAEPLAGGEAIFARVLANTTVTPATGQMMLSYWTAVTSGSATHVMTATVNAAAAGLTYAAVGVYSVAASGDLTLLGSTGDLHSTLWTATFTPYTSPLAFTRTAGSRYALGVLAVGTTPPQLQGAGMYFTFDSFTPLSFGVVTGQSALPASVLSASVGNTQSSGAEAVVTP